MAQGVDKERQDHWGGTISIVKLDIRVTRWCSSGECHGVGHGTCNKQESVEPKLFVFSRTGSIKSINNFKLHVYSWNIAAIFDPRKCCSDKTCQQKKVLSIFNYNTLLDRLILHGKTNNLHRRKQRRRSTSQ